MAGCRCLPTRKNSAACLSIAQIDSHHHPPPPPAADRECKKESGCNFVVWQGKYGSEQRPRRRRLGQMLKVESVSSDLQVAIINIFRGDQLNSSVLFQLVPVFEDDF